MVSFELHQTLRATASLLLLAAAAAPDTGSAQPISDEEADYRAQIAEQIRMEQAQNGAYSADLLDPLKALSLLYEESGDHARAAATLMRARQVIRANYGLRSLEQAPLMRRLALHEEARGNVAGAWDFEQELRVLAGQNPDDLRTVPILREIGDKRMDILDRYLAEEFPPEIILGCYYDPNPNDFTGSCTSGSRQVVVHSLLIDAWRNYTDAIRVLLRNGLYSSEELREIEMQIVRSSYPHRGYGAGKGSLRRLLAYAVATGAPKLSQIDALIQLADWDLLFVTNRGAPLEVYEKAHELLKLEQNSDESIESIFSPRVPVVLPTFLPNPLVAVDTQESTGHIDVAFELTKFGKSRQIEILDATPSATNEAKDRLVSLIANSRFRPRVTDGQFTGTAPIVVRYYLN